MRDGPEIIFTFVLGLYFRLKEKIVAQAQKKRQKAPENSWYIYIPLSNFMHKFHPFTEKGAVFRRLW